MTGSPSQEMILIARSLGVRAVLNKPFNPGLLCEMIKEIAAERQAAVIAADRKEPLVA